MSAYSVERLPTIGDLVRAASERFAAKDVLVADGARLTFSALERESRSVAKTLLAGGVVKGTRVALLAPNGTLWLTAWCALARIGAVTVPINTFVRPVELAWMLRDSGASRLLTVSSFLGNSYEAELVSAFPALARHDGRLPLYLDGAPFLRSIHVFGTDVPVWSAPLGPALPEIDDEFVARAENAVLPADPLVVIFTSGSSGPPKAVLHAHGTAVRYSREIVNSYRFEHNDIVFSSMPFFWVGGLGTGLLPSLHMGSTVVTQSAFEPGQALELIERERATIVLGWPQQGRTMAEHPTRAQRDLSAVRRTSMPDLVEESQRPPRVHADTLGMTETFGSHSNYDAYVALDPSKTGTSGPAIGGMQRKVIAPETGASLPPGRTGEICVRGPFLMIGLLGREREEVFDADGWYHTGDLGHLDEDDWLYFAGRLGDMIKTSGGANVTPAEVEAALVALPDVVEAYVTAVAAPGGGQHVAAAVVPRTGTTPEPAALRANLRDQLSAFKVPRHIWVCPKEQLPFLDSGKIDKPALSRLLASLATQNDAGGAP